MGVLEIGADTQRGRSPSILAHRVAARCAEAATRSHEAAVEALACLSRCDDLNNASERPAVLGRIPGRQNIHRVHIIRFNFRRKGGRSIVGQRKTIDDVLGLILRPARMQDAVRLEHPAWLRVHQVWQ